jgi:hypothetical protein
VNIEQGSLFPELPASEKKAEGPANEGNPGAPDVGQTDCSSGEVVSEPSPADDEDSIKKIIQATRQALGQSDPSDEGVERPPLPNSAKGATCWYVENREKILG